MWSKIKRKWRAFWWMGIKSKPIYKTIETPSFTPQEDITAYEVALCMKQPKLWNNESDLLEWRKNMPDNIRRHYTFSENKCIVDWDY